MGQITRDSSVEILTGIIGVGLLVAVFAGNVAAGIVLGAWIYSESQG